MTIMCAHALALMFIAKALVVLNQYLQLNVTLLVYLKFVLCVASMIPLCLLLDRRSKKVSEI